MFLIDLKPVTNFLDHGMCPRSGVDQVPWRVQVDSITKIQSWDFRFPEVSSAFLTTSGTISLPCEMNEAKAGLAPRVILVFDYRDVD